MHGGTVLTLPFCIALCLLSIRVPHIAASAPAYSRWALLAFEVGVAMQCIVQPSALDATGRRSLRALLQVFTPICNTMRAVWPKVISYAAHVPSFVDCWVRLLAVYLCT